MLKPRAGLFSPGHLQLCSPRMEIPGERPREPPTTEAIGTVVPEAVVCSVVSCCSDLGSTLLPPRQVVLPSLM